MSDQHEDPRVRMRAAREEAETILDQMMALFGEPDLMLLPPEGRFGFLVAAVMSSEADAATLATVVVTAMERLRIKEQLDQDLSER